VADAGREEKGEVMIEDPPVVRNTADEILKSMIRQEHWMARHEETLGYCHRNLVTIKICAVLLTVLAGLVFFFGVVIQTR
jgi:hypothetical protein